LRFFSKNPDAGPLDLRDHLAGAVANSLRNVSKTEILEGGTLYAFTCRRVNDFLAKNREYRKTGRWIAIDPRRGITVQYRSIMCRDLVSLGSAPSVVYRTPERIAKDILDALRGFASAKAWLHVGDLRQAVYEIYASQVERRPGAAIKADPETRCALNELCHFARLAAREAAGAYGWKPTHTRETRIAFERAASDKLQDHILLSGDGETNFYYLSQYIPDLTEENFGEYRGSFQHFWIVAFERWEKFRARP
jgi:hypothetical protein